MIFSPKSLSSVSGLTPRSRTSRRCVSRDLSQDTGLGGCRADWASPESQRGCPEGRPAAVAFFSREVFVFYFRSFN